MNTIGRSSLGVDELEAIQTLERYGGIVGNHPGILELQNTAIDDEGFSVARHLAKRVCSLALSGTRITDKSLAILPAFINLTALDLGGTRP